MNTIAKHIAAIIMVLIPLKIFAFWDFEYQDLYYKITDTSALTLEVVKPKIREGNFDIPSTIQYQNREYRVTGIGMRAFADCENLMAISIGEGVEYIAHSAFRNCTSLISAKLPKSLRKIDKDAFMDCKNLRTINIGENVTTIDIQAFYRCHMLEKITIESNIQKIELRAFAECGSINTIIMKSDTPPYIGHDVLGNLHNASNSIDINKTEIFVSKKGLSKYKKDQYWGKFANIHGIK